MPFIDFYGYAFLQTRHAFLLPTHHGVVIKWSIPHFVISFCCGSVHFSIEQARCERPAFRDEGLPGRVDGSWNRATFPSLFLVVVLLRFGSPGEG